jgi:hypothetical protein
MLYLSESLAGSGKRNDQFRPLGSDQPDWDCIYLGPTGRSLLWLPSPSVNPALTALSADKDEAIGAAAKQALDSKLGVSIKLGKTADVLAEILLDGGKGWPALKPTRGFYEIWLANQRWFSLKEISGGATATSNFDGTESPLSEGGHWIKPGDYAAIQKFSGEACPVTQGGDCSAQYVYGSFAGDHSARLYVSNRQSDHQLQGPCTRIQADAALYVVIVDYASNVALQLSKVDAARSFTALGAAFVISAPGTVFNLTLDSTGTTHTVSLNGVSQGTRTDATYSGGDAGLYMYAEGSVLFSAATQIVMTGWTAPAAGTAGPLPILGAG